MARQRGDKWQADVLIDGVRKRPSFATKADAEAFERSVGEGYSPDASMTLGAFVDRVFDDLWGEARSRSYIEGNLRVLYRYIPRETVLTKINTPLIKVAVSAMRKDGKANGTINRKLANLSKLLKLAHEQNLIMNVPSIERRKEGKARERILTKEEEVKITEFLDHIGKPGIAAIIQFLLYTGGRVGEVQKLDRKHVAGGYVTFHHETTKNGDTRSVPMIPKAKAAWDTMSRLTNASCPFGAIPYWTFRDYWLRIKEHLGVADDPQFVPHMLRHTCATRLVLSDVSIPRVQKWMGHKSIQVTMRYTHLVSKDLDVAAAALEAA